MKDLIKSSKLIIKRNWIWFLLIFTLIFTSSIIFEKNNIEQYYAMIQYHIDRLNWLDENRNREFSEYEDAYSIMDSEIIESGGITPYNGESISNYETFDENDLKESYDLFLELTNYYGYEQDSYEGFVFYSDGLEDGLEFRDSILSNYQNYFLYSFDDEEPLLNTENFKLNMTNKLSEVNDLVILGIILFTMILTSLENLTDYYEFTRLFPWTKEKNLIMKVIFGLCIVLIASILIHFAQYMMWKSSVLSNVLNTEGIAFEIFKVILIYIGLFLISISLGEVSGNFFGHIGLLIIGLFGLNLINYNIQSTIGVFTELSVNNILRTFEDNMYKNDILNIIYSPQNVLGARSIQEILTFLGIGVLFFLLGIYWAKTSKSENSGYFVKDNIVSKIAFILAIFTTANIFYSLFTSFSSEINILGIFVYALLLVLSFKIYKILFNSKLGL